MKKTTQHSSSIFLLTALCSGFIFVLLTGLVYRGRLRSSDFNLTVKIQDRFPKRLDDNVATLIDFGAMEIQAFVFMAVLITLPLPKKTKILLITLYITGLAVTLAGKAFLPHPAPPYMFQRGNQGLSFPGLHVQVDSSYPSGHTYRVVFLAAMCIASLVVAVKKKPLLMILSAGTTLFALIVVVGLIVLGKHWTSDVIGGIGLSISLASSAFWLDHRFETAKN